MIIIGIFLYMFSFLFGLWSKCSYNEATKIYRLFNFLICMICSINLGFLGSVALSIPIYFGFFWGILGFFLKKPINKWIKIKLGKADAITSFYFLKLAEQDGEDVKQLFVDKLIKKEEFENQQSQLIVDDLISIYNEARQECGLNTVNIDKNKIVYI